MNELVQNRVVEIDTDPDKALDLTPYLSEDQRLKLKTPNQIRLEQGKIYRLMRKGKITPTRGIRMISSLAMILKTVEVQLAVSGPSQGAPAGNDSGLPETDRVLARLAAAAAEGDREAAGADGSVLPAVGAHGPEGHGAPVAAGSSA